MSGKTIISTCAVAVSSALCAFSAVAAQYEVAFASFGPLNSDVFIADADGSNAKPLIAHTANDANASFGHDGSVIFSSNRSGSWDIYRAKADGSKIEALVAHKAYDDQAALSPDGRSLAFVSSRSGQADVWVLDLKTKALRNLTNHPAGDFRPAWLPDGKWIAFTSDRDSKRPRIPAGFAPMLSVEVFVMRADGSELRRVSHEDSFAGSPQWSADGKRIVYYAATVEQLRDLTSPRRLPGTTQIVSVDVASGQRTLLTQGAGEKLSPHWVGDKVAYTSVSNGGIEFTTGSGARGNFRCPSWSADGKRMLFHREVDSAWPPHRNAPSPDPNFRLVRTGIFPSFTPDGKHMISNDNLAGILHNKLLVMNADGSNRSVLLEHADKSVLSPALSWQGDRVAFGLGRFFQNTLGPARADIAIINRDGTGFQTVTDGTANYGFPSWSRDGRRIVYREAGAERNALLIMDVAMRTVRTLLAGKAHYNFPSFSPTDDVVLFTSDHDGDYELYTIREDGSDLKRLTHSPGNDAHSAWSPDGQWIAFTSARSGFKDENFLMEGKNPQGQGEIFVMRADGSEQRALTDDAFEDGTPGWRKLGR